jgi:hypothetical protein
MHKTAAKVADERGRPRLLLRNRTKALRDETLAILGRDASVSSKSPRSEGASAATLNLDLI